MDFRFPEVGDTRTATVLGTMLGGEHFLDDHFSLGVEFQANMLWWNQPGSLWESDKSMTNVNTGAVALATFYF